MVPACTYCASSWCNTFSLLHTFPGSLNKVFMFDKASSKYDSTSIRVMITLTYRDVHFCVCLASHMLNMKMMLLELLRQPDIFSTTSVIWSSSQQYMPYKLDYSDFNITTLRQYSIGVTTGVAFCGVVGHPQRHEYTVIGQKVNMAARLMMKFPNAVVCDETTHTKSGLGSSQFSLEPPVDLKGITNPEKIYRFLTERYIYSM